MLIDPCQKRVALTSRKQEPGKVCRNSGGFKLVSYHYKLRCFAMIYLYICITAGALVHSSALTCSVGDYNMLSNRVSIFSSPKDEFNLLRRDCKFQRSWPLLTFYSILVAATLFTTGASKTTHNGCPKGCVCPNSGSVQCTNQSLMRVPSDIPKSVMLLDLSGNRGLKITETTFKEFRLLRTLKLENCSLNTAFTIPHHTTGIYLSGNELSYKQFYKMFSSASPFMRIINAANNQIQISNRQPLLKAVNLNVRDLDLSGNSMKTVYNEIFGGFHSLKKLLLDSMGIEAVEESAFHDLSNLFDLSLAHNNIVNLPINLFRPLKNLRKIALDENKLQAVPNFSGLPKEMIGIDLGYNYIKDISTLSEMGIKTMAKISLWQNNITTLPKHVFQKVSAFRINLSFNKIREIQGYSFTACAFLDELYLDSNELISISETAFRSIRRVTVLSLSNNKLKVFPPELFMNMSVNLLFLYRNNISSIKNAWKGFEKPPISLLLFDNPIQILDTESLNGLANHTEVVISCSMLSEISKLKNIQPLIRCTPAESFYVISPSGSLKNWLIFQRFGFNCTNIVRGGILNYNCTPCPLGYYGTRFDGINNNICQECPVGSFYQDKIVRTTCEQCPVGQYVPPEKAPGKGPLDCKTCPEGTRSDKSAGYRACYCLDGFTRLSRFGLCARCKGPGITCDKDYQMLRSGFWWSWEYNATCKAKYQAFIRNLETFDNSYSRQTVSFDCEMPLPHKCPNKIACLGTVHGSCHKNYTGPLCALCQKNYYRHFNMCVRCPNVWVAVLQLLAYLLAFIVICIVINWADKIVIKADNKSEFSVKSPNTSKVKHQNRERTVADVILSTLKILLGFYQVLNGTIHSFPHIPWPNSLTKALKIFQYIELEVLRIPSLRCIKPDWELNAIDEFWLSLGITIIVPLFIGIYYGGRKAYLNKTIRTQRAYMKSITTCKKQCVRGVILLLFSIFPSTSRRVFQILPIACHKVCLSASGYCISYLRADYSIKCLSVSSKKSWILYLAYASLFIPFGFIVVLFVSLVYIKHSGHVNGDHRIGSENENLLDDLTEYNETHIGHIFGCNQSKRKQETIFQFALKFCHENYQPSCWYWEVTEILRKLLFISILPLFSPFSDIFLGLSIIIAGLFALLHAYKRPIQDYFENWLQMVSLSVIPANLCIGYILDTITTQHYSLFEKKVEKLGISVILIVLNSAVVVIVMLQCARVKVRKLKQLRRRNRCSCKCCIACILPCVEPDE